MKRLPGFVLTIGALVLTQLAFPMTTQATQGHGGIEGIYAHQLAHLFFILSMGVLIYWLRSRKLVQSSGWRFIQYSAFFFILWNGDAILVHALDDQFNIIRVQRISTWFVQLSDPFEHNGIKILYYIAKLDHLLCVPALLFLYFGLKRLLQEQTDRTEERASF